jgi:Ca-activated chloride channel family protein
VPVKTFQKQLVDPVQFTLRYKNSGSPTRYEMTEQPNLFYTPFEQLSKSQKFASAVVWFGSLLRNSRYVKPNSWNDLLTLAKPVVEPTNYSQVEFLSLVEQAKKLYGKKRKKEE